MPMIFKYFLFLLCVFYSLAVVWGVDLSVDGKAEIWRKLQQTSGSNRETCGLMCQYSQNRPAHGLSQWILRSSSHTGVYSVCLCVFNRFRMSFLSHRVWCLQYFVLVWSRCVCACLGLLRGHLVSMWGGRPGEEDFADSSLVTEGHLPSRLRPQKPGFTESQVSDSLTDQSQHFAFVFHRAATTNG